MARKFIPSPQQQAVFDFIRRMIGNAFIEAVAGAGKTTTLIELCRLIQGKYIAFAAYNKKIADEIKEKVAREGLKVNVGTFHSYGFGAWRKVAPNVRVAKGNEKWDMVLFDVPEEYHAFVKRTVSLAKQRALGVFGSIHDTAQWYSIVDHYSLSEDLDETCDIEQAIRYCISVLLQSNNLCREIIDFDDMIYAPVFFNARMWQNDYVLVDEAQDTNPARRALARKMLRPGGRIIFVGDRHQAIYGFTGADNDAVNRIIEEFNCEQLPLTVTYRCPKTIVAAAQRYVSHIEAHEDAPEGEVRNVTEEEFEKLRGELRPTDAILCRNTKPLVALAYTLLRAGIACHVEGRDIGAGLLVMVNKWKVKSVETFLKRLEKWETQQIERHKAKNNELAIESVVDKCETLRVLCDGCATLDDVRARIADLFRDTDENNRNSLTLSTVHKSKGREWEQVYILGFSRYMPSRYAKLPWEQEQERNLIYVAFTRAKERLTIVG
jgi:DNA helicase-2/ATP-dependent DNA helicase PcrA